MESKYEDIISFAMQWEEDSANLYKEMIKLTKNPNVKAMYTYPRKFSRLFGVFLLI